MTTQPHPELSYTCPFCSVEPNQLCRSRHGRETNSLHSRRIRLALPDPGHAPDTRWRISVGPAGPDAKLHESNGKLLMYVGMIVALSAVIVTPCRNITDKQLCELVAWVRTREPLPPEPKCWCEGPTVGPRMFQFPSMLTERSLDASAKPAKLEPARVLHPVSVGGPRIRP
jgi:hypothetical protein